MYLGNVRYFVPFCRSLFACVLCVCVCRVCVCMCVCEFVCVCAYLYVFVYFRVCVQPVRSECHTTVSISDGDPDDILKPLRLHKIFCLKIQTYSKMYTYMECLLFRTLYLSPYLLGGDPDELLNAMLKSLCRPTVAEAYTRMHTHTLIHKHTHNYAHNYTHAQKHTHTHTHTRTHRVY
jgi:hypothetical protein